MTDNTEIKWSPFALEKLEEIYDYYQFLSKDSSIAFNMVDGILKTTKQLERFPESGQVELFLKAIKQDSRYILYKHYKIIYEYHPVRKLIIISDVFHTSQNPDKLL